jgi:hypothetical protein
MPRIRIAILGFFLLYLLAVTWPVGTWFASAEPFVLGLPLSFFWPIVWIVLGFLALVVLDRTEAAARDDDPEARP